jgi:hypothetical protein
LKRQLTACLPLQGRINIDLFSFDGVHLLGDTATHSPAPRSAHHAALLVLAGMSLPRPHALPGAPITAPVSAFNCRFKDDFFETLPRSRFDSSIQVFFCPPVISTHR